MSSKEEKDVLQKIVEGMDISEDELEFHDASSAQITELHDEPTTTNQNGQFCILCVPTNRYLISSKLVFALLRIILRRKHNLLFGFLFYLFNNKNL